MKNILKLIAISLVLFVAASCEEPETGLTKITYYAQVDLNGDQYMYATLGEDFVDPGVTATMKGKDVSDMVIVKGEVDTEESGMYTLTYTVVNEDGFSASASRYVLVKDPADQYAGIYNVRTNESYRLSGGETVIYNAKEYVEEPLIIINQGDGTYSINDLLGGWYWQRAGYGEEYCIAGKFEIANDGTINLTYNKMVGGWADELVGFTEAKFTQVSGTTSAQWVAEYVEGMIFNVTADKVE
ncbi:MAG: DUF5012 domain-containing protein [Salinivirgaceae bacterium]|nr:DUF5012 domain-containing protein [Salinivirgaceae bacterium]